MMEMEHLDRTRCLWVNAVCLPTSEKELSKPFFKHTTLFLVIAKLYKPFETESNYKYAVILSARDDFLFMLVKDSEDGNAESKVDISL